MFTGAVQQFNGFVQQGWQDWQGWQEKWEERQDWHECFHALAYHEVASLPVFGVILLVTFALLLDGISLIILLLGLGGLLVFELMRNPVNMLGASFTIVSGIWGQQATELHCQ